MKIKSYTIEKNLDALKILRGSVKEVHENIISEYEWWFNALYYYFEAVKYTISY